MLSPASASPVPIMKLSPITSDKKKDQFMVTQDSSLLSFQVEARIEILIYDGAVDVNKSNNCLNHLNIYFIIYD